MEDNLKITTRDSCRVCYSKELSDVGSLGDLYISNFVNPGETGIKAPLDLTFCNGCSLVQLKHTAPQELLYARHYWYKSGVTDTMKRALRDITQKIETNYAVKEGDVLLDIGSNDGTLLRTYETPGVIKVGVEPATNLATEGKKGLEHFINDFWGIDSYMNTVGKKAKAITAIGMFYDMEDPNQFILDAKNALTKDGVFVAQLMCLKNMLDNNDLGNICHEHLEYYSFASLEHLLNKNQLEIMDVEVNNINGGSYRIYARPFDGTAVPASGGKERVQNIRDDELSLKNSGTYLDFFKRIQDSKDQCVNFIRAENAKGKKTWVYGASTKGNTILQYYGLDNKDIVGAAERSPEKFGKVTIGTNIPIFSEDEARQRQPDYFLVMPYGFIKEFHAREKEWRAKGGKFLVPLPEFKIIE